MTIKLHIYDILPNINVVSSAEDLLKTIIFTYLVNAMQHLCCDAHCHYSHAFHHHIDFLHAHQTAKAKQCVMKLFKKGVIKILVATEAAGMVWFN